MGELQEMKNEMTTKELVDYVLQNELTDEFEQSYENMSQDEMNIVFQEYGYFYDEDKQLYILDSEKVNYK